MDALDWARWQFAVTTVYHVLFVPLTIGLSALVAIVQTVWVRTGDGRYLRHLRGAAGYRDHRGSQPAPPAAPAARPGPRAVRGLPPC